MRLGIIVPALVTELPLLRDCLRNLGVALAPLRPDVTPRIVVILQGEGTLDDLEDVEGVELIKVAACGVSQARNRGLAHLEAGCDRLMFVDVSVRPSHSFFAAALTALERVALVSAPVGFAAASGGAASPANLSAYGQISAGRLIYRGFIWSTLFRTDLVAGLRFDEHIGPGTNAEIQAGEDGRFLYSVLRRAGLHQAGWLPDAPVHRLPRPDLPAKIARYAYGQGVMLGQLLSAPGWTLADRAYLSMRATLFIANSLRQLAGDAATARRRLRGLRDGMIAGTQGTRHAGGDIPALD